MIEFKSRFARMIEGFVGMKRALGYSYKSEVLLLASFDAFCASEQQCPDAVGRAMVEKWIATGSSAVRPGTMNHRISVMRELGRYAAMCGTEFWIPPRKFRARGPAYECRIMTEDEVAGILAEADRFEDPSRKWLGLSVSAILRLLYSTGMRPGEAVDLRPGDLDLESGTARIMESKGHKNRLIALGDDIVGILRGYARVLEGCAGRAHFFYDGGGDAGARLEPRRLGAVLRRLCSAAGLEPPLPRAYDFRHAFITARILRWHREGADLKARLPFLSAYVGHNSIQDTLYYFRLAPGLLGCLGAVAGTAAPASMEER